MKTWQQPLIICLLLMLASQATIAQPLTSSYSAEEVVAGIDVPWGMVQLPNGNMLVSERAGELFLINPSNREKQKIAGLPAVSSRGQGGLLDLALHPKFEQNGWLYFSYSSSQGEGGGDNTAIMRARLNGNELVDKQLIYKASPNSTKKQHYGSRLEFDQQGLLYFSIGDRGERDRNPQDITRDAGKIYRLNDDGSIPHDNPFIDVKGANPAIYSFGHRNPQGMALNPDSGEIWVHEHGPRGGDEINIIKKGSNYGWPVISYGINYSGSKFTELTEKPGMEQPVWYWVPSIAPSGMTFVTSAKYPQWQGQLLIGSLKFGYLVLCKLEQNKVVSQKLLFEGIGRVRNVEQLADGYLYVATDNNKIFRIIADNQAKKQ